MRSAVLGESYLAERNAEFGCPSLVVDIGGDIPDGVPVHVPFGAIEPEGVHLDTGRIDGELEGGPLVVIAVEGGIDPVGGAFVVAPRQVGHYLVRLGIVCLDADVDSPVVVDDSNT